MFFNAACSAAESFGFAASASFSVSCLSFSSCTLRGGGGGGDVKKRGEHEIQSEIEKVHASGTQALTECCIFWVQKPHDSSTRTANGAYP